MPENKSNIDRITGTITSTTALIVAVGGLLAVLAGYGFLKPDQDAQKSPDPPVSTCFDGKKNGLEEDVDCGGTCPDCDPPSPPAPTCTDRIKNGTETGIDCGGTCSPCPIPPTCTDRIKNGTETGVDCGGTCPPCDPGNYTNLKNVTLEGDRLNKSGGNAWNGGATSKKHLPAGVAGGVSYKIKTSDGHFLFGLTPNAGDASYEQIKFALAVAPRNSSSVQINVFESGTNRTSSQPSFGTEIRIYRSASGEITYLADGQKMIGFPTTTYSGRLLLDISIKRGGVDGLKLLGGWRE